MIASKAPQRNLDHFCCIEDITLFVTHRLPKMISLLLVPLVYPTEIVQWYQLYKARFQSTDVISSLHTAVDIYCPRIVSVRSLITTGTLHIVPNADIVSTLMCCILYVLNANSLQITLYYNHKQNQVIEILNIALTQADGCGVKW